MRWLLLVAVTLTACSAGQPQPPVPSGGPVQTSVAATVEPSPVTREWLADGSVDENEMRAALATAVECANEAEPDLEPPARVVRFEPRVGFELAPGGGSGEDAGRGVDALAACESRLVHPVADVYLAEHGLSGAEEAERERLILACLAEAGNEVANRQFVEVISDPDTVGLEPCARRANTQINLTVK